MLLLRLGDQVRGEGTLLVGGAVAGEFFGELLGLGGEVVQRLFGTRLVLLEGVSLLQQGGCGGFLVGQLRVLLLQGAQGVKERLELGFLLGGLEIRECGEGGLFGEDDLCRGFLIAECRKQGAAVLLQRGCTGRLLLLAGGERLRFGMDLRVLCVQGRGGTCLRQLFTLRLVLVGAYGQAGAALAELLVFAPVGLQLGAFGEQAGVPVGFVGEALLLLLFACGGFAGAFYSAGDPCVEGFGSDILGSDALSGELFGSLRLHRVFGSGALPCSIFSVRIRNIQ